MVQQTFLKPTVLDELASQSQDELIDSLEGLVSPNLQVRRSSLAALVAMDAHRRSPLAAALLAGQIRERDLALRAAVVATLAELFAGDSQMGRPSSQVMGATRYVLAAMRTREIFALLQVILHDANRLGCVSLLLQACSFSGETLLAIVKDRRANIAVRVAAVQAVAAIGYLDAISVLENLHQRIAGRVAGQIPMAFAERFEAEAERLLPALHQAVHSLEEAGD